jgi:D-alanyl-D-alanine carboxypeptidase
MWAVVMGADGPGAHFSDAATLLDHGFERLRIVDTIGRGTPFRLETGTLDPEVTALARLHTLSLLAKLETSAEVVEEVAEPVEPLPEVITAELPGPAEALRWLYAEVFGG